MNWLFRRRTVSQDASALAKHGATIRRQTERERIHAMARQLCAEKGIPVPSVLSEGGR